MTLTRTSSYAAARSLSNSTRPVVLALLLTAVLTSDLRGAAPTTEQRTLARAAEGSLKRAGNLARQKKWAEAGEAVGEAQQNLDKLAADKSPEVAALAAPLVKQIARMREQLESQGVRLPPSASAAASFTKQVAPILVAKCATCHIQRSRGQFNMGSYVSLSRGSQNGPVIEAGSPQGSRIVELLETGDMPRGAGAKVTADELALISAWIAAGAKFDGPDSAAPLVSFANAPPAAAPVAPKLPVVAATGKEAVQFARDVAPTLLANCIGCHGEQDPRNNLSMATFNRLLQGGDSGVVLVPGKAADSLLVKKLRGTDGARMPLEKPPLGDDTIARIEKWIDTGAKFDGGDPAASLEDLAARAIAQTATHEQLMQNRAALAAKNWRLILPDSPANREETPNVLLVGAVSPEILSDVARVTETQAAKLRKLFKVPAEQPLVKGRLTLYVFDKRYDYGEVGTMFERREIPSAWRGHWRADGVDAYACILLTSHGDAPPGLLAQQMVGAYIANLGKIPRWFAEGTARAVAARFEPKDPRIKLWDDQLPRVLATTDKRQDFFSDGLPPEDNDVLSYSYVKFLMSSAPRYASLIAALQQGVTFDQAFAKAYAAAPAELIDAWLARASKRRG
jgi:hypothetical protein